jgi:hypothetical protein
MTEKTFTQAGVSTLNGETKVRYANDALRVKVLAKGGHTGIDLVELGEPLTKEQAVAKLIGIKFGQGNPVIEQALAAEVSKQTPTRRAVNTTPAVTRRAAKSKVKPITLETIKAKAVPQATKSRAQIQAELADLENAPF